VTEHVRKAQSVLLASVRGRGALSQCRGCYDGSPVLDGVDSSSIGLRLPILLQWVLRLGSRYVSARAQGSTSARQLSGLLRQ